MLPEFVERLKEKKKEIEKEYPDCPWVCHYRGKQVKSWKRGFATAKKKPKFTRRIRPYDLRHYHITHALANGADIYDLARRMGHKNPRMIVKIYSHLDKDVVERKAHPLPSLYDRSKIQDDQG